MQSSERTIARLVSNRLTLRRFEITDAPSLSRITNDPLVLRNLLRTSCPFTVDDARKMILRFRKKNRPVWAIDNGQLIGLIGIAGEFGLWLGRRAWNRGYGEEAARMVIDHAFTHMNMTVLQANPISDNKASHRLMQKLGFLELGRGQSFCEQRNRMVSLLKYESKKSLCQENG